MRTSARKRRSLVVALAAFASIAMPGTADADAPKLGDPAPAFSATDLDGKTRTLSEFAGRYVVLEWHNQGCPFVKKHYDSGNMQKLQKELTGKGVVWLSVISSAPGKQGYVTPGEEKRYLAAKDAVPTTVLFDPEGAVGRAYGAKTTPHMFVIDDKGVLVYAGAIDDNPSPDAADAATAKNYVRAAYEEASAGKPVTAASTPPYGCGVKYQTR
ncbi:MAG: thioredoxin family protein [Deltaproteobacteria bacterium]|nr:thioredoxin family protein [Deltaproteobacteria bacterium]